MKRGFLYLLLTSLLLVGCANKSVATTTPTQEITTNVAKESVAKEETPEVKLPEEYEVSLCAVGDNLYHSTIYNKGKLADGTYNFDFIYENVKDTISSYDLAIVNQETVLVDQNISSYPCFGTPKQAGDALINTGFDIVLGATNHSYDKRESGVLSTVEFWKQHPEITYTGLHDSVDDYNTVRIVEKNNIKIAILNYTYGLNGFVIPNDKYYLVDTLYDKEKIINDLQYAEANADVTIVCPHWGTEYVYDEINMQKEWAQLFTQYGADIIIGAHPHVVEPVKEVVSENGNKSICYYSLGNFVSGQDEKPRILEGMASLKIKKTVDNKNTSIEINDVNFTPMVMHYNSSTAAVYMLKDYTNDLAANSKLKATPEYLWSLWNEINEDSTFNFDKE